MIRFYVFLTVFISSLSATYAQGLSGYVITLTGDTLRGTVVEQTAQRIALYGSAGSTPEVFLPAQVQGYGLLGKAAVRSRVVRQASGSSAMYFVLPMQLGRASLYSYTDENGLLLLPTAAATDTLYELTAANWHVLLNRYLRDCPNLEHSSNRLLSMSFAEYNVRRVFMEYNTCLDPNWKPSANPVRAMWRYGIGVRGASSYTFYGGNTQGRPQPVSGRASELGLDWTSVRASGLQVTVSGSYFKLTERTKSFQTHTPIPAEEQISQRYQLLDATITISQRISKPNKPAFLLGLGIGSLYHLSSEVEYKYRPIGSTITQVTKEQIEYGGFLTHADASLGTVLPIGRQQEIRLTAIYQRYIFAKLNGVGFQLAYNWFWK